MIRLLVLVVIGCQRADVDPVADGIRHLQLSEPLIAVGGDRELTTGHSLFRVVGAWMDGGNLVVADGGSGEVRTYDDRGALLASFGGLGQGPGEFRTMSRAWKTGDRSFGTFDAALARVSLWTRDTGLGDEYRLDGPWAVVAGAGQRIILSSRSGPRPPAPGPRVRIDSTTIYLASIAPFDTVRVREMPWQTHLSVRTPAGTSIGMVHPLEGRGFAAIQGDLIVSGFSSDRDLAVHSMEGDSIGSVWLALPRRLFSDGLKDTWERETIRRASDTDRSVMRDYLRSLPLPDSLPVYDAMFVDDTDHFIVRRFVVPGESEGQWYRVTKEGVPIDLWHLPARARPLFHDGMHIVLHTVHSDAGEEVSVHEFVDCC